ncbi:MAG: hypothetical protein U1E97_04305 [Alphaproteobacteria bacterium]
MGLLARSCLEIKSGALILVLEGPACELNGAVVNRRLRTLARALGLRPEMRLA